MSDPIRVLIVDDSALHRRAVTESLQVDDGSIEIVGYAKNGQEALNKIDELTPSLVTLDIEMPIMNGIECLKEVRKRGNKVPIVAVSTLTMEGAKITVECLTLGAQDYVHKPQGKAWADSVATLRSKLLPLVLHRGGMGDGQLTSAGVASEQQANAAKHAIRPAWTGADLVAVGCSTGGPEALQTFIGALPESLNVPIVVAQHMPKMFTKFLADRLDAQTPLRVVEGEDGMILKAGMVVIAPGDLHMEVEKTGDLRVSTNQGPAVHAARPAIDVLLQSVAAATGGRSLAVLLTGMGRDGEIGAAAVHKAGGRVVVQDEETSVVWGIPGAVTRAGLADRTVSIDRMAEAVLAEIGS